MHSAHVQARLDAIRSARRSPRTFSRVVDGIPVGKASDAMGIHTFHFHRMQEKLPHPVYERLLASVREAGTIDRDLADAVAHAVKEWALSKGATHFCHWFQPMTGLTAEKHEAFLDLDRSGAPLERLSGRMLSQSEPDASSFPSGGTRSTFEARGYTAWDPSSPMFLMETPNGRTLCIPSVFISYTGHALDTRTRLLRSMAVLRREARALLARVGEDLRRVTPTVGVEQEYFLVDRDLYALRPDLVITGRTLLGARPPKGQSMEDHYFGSIPARVLAFMEEVEFELWKLGVPVKTRHNEVAPAQFELAPLHAEANVAVDHNQLVMEVLRRVAPLHGFAVLLHEKPFAWVNGSGKHVNWSMQTETGDNLLDPGDTPHANVRFLACLAAVVVGVWRHRELLRATVATLPNDARLGANEAPPAILSVFLGDQLSGVVDAICAGQAFSDDPGQAVMDLGLHALPRIARDTTDRNRTSPFAFTGNKFEFRAPGSSQNPADPVTALNVAVADGMRQVAAWIDREGSVMGGIRLALVEARPILFDGNGYSAEWREEAVRRGLPVPRNAFEALDALKAGDGAVVELGVFSASELDTWRHVALERYVAAMDIEADVLKDLVDTLVVPAAMEEKRDLMWTRREEMRLVGPELRRLDALIQSLDAVQEARDALDAARTEAHVAQDSARAHAEKVAPAMGAVRAAADRLEGLVSDGRWPLPKEREVLFL